jgi:hypothetical protein
MSAVSAAAAPLLDEEWVADSEVEETGQPPVLSASSSHHARCGVGDRAGVQRVMSVCCPERPIARSMDTKQQSSHFSVL